MCNQTIAHYQPCLHLRSTSITPCTSALATPGLNPYDCAAGQNTYSEEAAPGPCPICTRHAAFAALSRLAPEMASREEERARRFVRGPLQRHVPPPSDLSHSTDDNTTGDSGHYSVSSATTPTDRTVEEENVPSPPSTGEITAELEWEERMAELKRSREAELEREARDADTWDGEGSQSSCRMGQHVWSYVGGGGDWEICVLCGHAMGEDVTSEDSVS